MNGDAAVDVVPRASLRRRVRVIGGMIARGNRRLTFLMLVVIACNTVAGAALSLSLKWMIDGALDHQVSDATLAALLGGFAAGVLGAAGRVYSNLQDLVAGSAGVDVNRDTLASTASMPSIEHLERPEYLDEVDIVSRSGYEVIRSAFAVADFVSLVLRILVGVWLLATVQPVLILLPVFAMPSVLLAPRAEARVSDAATTSAERARAADNLHTLFTQPGAAMEMRLFSCAEELDSRADVLWGAVARIKLRGALQAALIDSVGWISMAVGYVLALLVVVIAAADGRATPGDVLLVATLALLLRGNIAETTASARRSLAALRLADRFIWLDDQTAVQEAAFSGRATVPARIERGITVEDISFQYPGSADLTLEHLDLELPAGSTVAIVGDNGAGKSTLVKLLCRFYLPTAGRICVDGIDLAHFDVRAWRAHATGSFQDFLRLEESARYSVGVGDLARVGEDAAVAAALDRADAQDLARRWPEGLDAHLGKSYADGHELSGGQWQKVAIARGMMREEPLLLLLDEPTASLDSFAEQALFERYVGASRRVREYGGIVVLVSHRFSSVRMADLIVVLANGSVAEQGTHDALMARGGPYASMFDKQASAYE